MYRPRFANKSLGRLTVPAVSATALVGTYLYYRQPSKNASVGGQAARSRKKRDEEGLGAAGIGQNMASGGHETGQVGSGVQTGTGDVERTVKTTAESRDKLPSGGVGGGVGGGGANVRAVEMSGGKNSQNDVTEGLKDAFKPSDSTQPHVFESRGSSGESRGSSGESRGSSGESRVSSGDDQASSQNATSGSQSQSSSLPGRQQPPRYQDSDKKVTSSSYPTSKADYQGNKETTETKGTNLSQKLQGVFGQGGSSSAEQGEVYKKYHDTKIHSNHADTPTKKNVSTNPIGASPK